MQRILVTGGAGFIGSHLIDTLLSQGHQIIALDDLSTGSLTNLSGAMPSDRCRFVQGSVTDHVLVDQLALGVDRIIHLAAAVGVRRILTEQVGSIRLNLLGTETVLLAASAHRLPVFIASTSEVYGKAQSVPFKEDDDIVLGTSRVHRWSYAATKLMDEFYALAMQRERGLQVTIGRFFNVTGPRQSPAYGMVLPNFCKRALAGQALEVYGDGKQARCFLHAHDCVQAVLGLISCPQAIGQVVNIGSNEEISMFELANRVIDRAGSKSKVELLSYEKAYPEGGFEDMRRRIPDTTRLSNLTGWKQRHNLNATIDQTLADQRTAK